MSAGASRAAPRILLVDDELNVLVSLARILKRKGFDVDTEQRSEEALGRLLSSGPAVFDAVVVDLKMPGMDGLDLLARLRSQGVSVPVIVLTGYGTIRNAVEATRLGAFEYLVKPSSPEEIVAVLRRATGQGEVAPPPRPEAAAPCIVGASPALRSLLRQVDRIAATDSNILLVGESGTGKELIARALHDASPRRGRPFVAVNCATLSTNLAESLLFGYRRGTFTGADSDREGFFQAADGGTLLLDEIGELHEPIQAVLLRALQERAITRVGDTRPVRVDVRLICATNKDIAAEVAAHRFRSDLYYRINVVQLDVPPLRERVEDIPDLAAAFLAERAAGKRPPRTLGEETLTCLRHHDWPGNVRELRNVLERADALTDEAVIGRTHLPSYLQYVDRLGDEAANLSALEQLEKQHIHDALEASDGRRSEAARRLGIDRKRLYRKMRRLGLLEGRR